MCWVRRAGLHCELAMYLFRNCCAMAVGQGSPQVDLIAHRHAMPIASWLAAACLLLSFACLDRSLEAQELFNNTLRERIDPPPSNALIAESPSLGIRPLRLLFHPHRLRQRNRINRRRRHGRGFHCRGVASCVGRWFNTNLCRRD